MRWGEEFEELPPLLFAIAYRIVGSVAEAEVEDTWLLWAPCTELSREVSTYDPSSHRMPFRG